MNSTIVKSELNREVCPIIPVLARLVEIISHRTSAFQAETQGFTVLCKSDEYLTEL